MAYRVQIEGGDVFDVAADEENLLRGALRAGVGFPYDCNVGGCGGCRFELVSGEMENLWPEAPGLTEREKKRGRRLACQTKVLSDCVIKLRPSDEHVPPVPTRRLAAVLKERREIAPGMGEFVFQTDWPAHFLPGQYGVFHPPGVTGPRAYSMSNLPNDSGEWRFVIRRTAAGVGSNAMFDALAVGGTITLDAPYGHAFFRADTGREIIGVAGGSGIGPVVSIARAAVAMGRPVRVFEGARTAGDLCFPALVSASELAALDYRPVLSAEPEGSAWAGARGFVHNEVEQSVTGAPENRDYYFAGPPPMIDAMNDLLVMRWLAPLGQIHTDKFF